VRRRCAGLLCGDVESQAECGQLSHNVTDSDVCDAALLYPSHVVAALFRAQSHRIGSDLVLLCFDVCVKCMLNTFDMHESGTHVTSCLLVRRHPQLGKHMGKRDLYNVLSSTVDLNIGKRLFMLPSAHHLDSEQHLWS